MKETIFLIPGASPEASKPIFSALKTTLKLDYDIVELEKANEASLLLKAKNVRSKILVGKSVGGRIVLDYQLKQKDSSALVLLAPAVRPDDKYKEIEIPVLIVHGTKDYAIPLENSRELEKCFRSSKFIEVTNVGHGFGGKELQTAKNIADWIGSLGKNTFQS